MKNTVGLYKRQRDNKGKRRKLPQGNRSAVVVPVEQFEYEKARDAETKRLKALISQ